MPDFELNVRDIENLLKLLSRTQYQGLEEAEVAVLLKHKLQAKAQAILAPKDPEPAAAESEEL